MEYPSEPGSVDPIEKPLYDRYVSTHTRERGEARLDSVDYSVRRFLPMDRTLRVLDLGCGSGAFLLVLKDLGFRNVEGVDLSAEQISLARSRGLTSAHMGDALTYLQEHPNTFDVITANDFIEHLDRSDVLDLLHLVEGSLRPGGVFLAQTPNGASPFFGSYFYGDFTHRIALTESSVRQLCALVGFGQVDVRPVPPRVAGIKGLGRRVVWTISTFPVKLALAAESGRVRGHIVTSNLVFRAQKKDQWSHGNLDR